MRAIVSVWATGSTENGAEDATVTIGARASE